LLRDKDSTFLTLNSKEWTPVELQWHSSAPRYVEDYKSYAWLRDYKIYVWQPHLDVNIFPPQKTLIVLSPASEDARDMMVLLRPTLERAEILPKLLCEERQKAATTQGTMAQFMETEILTTILCLYRIIVCDTRNFIEELMGQIATLLCDN
jgi:hypothetical protein